VSVLFFDLICLLCFRILAIPRACSPVAKRSIEVIMSLFITVLPLTATPHGHVALFVAIIVKHQCSVFPDAPQLANEQSVIKFLIVGDTSCCRRFFVEVQFEEVSDSTRNRFPSELESR